MTLNKNKICEKCITFIIINVLLSLCILTRTLINYIPTYDIFFLLSCYIGIFMVHNHIVHKSIEYKYNIEVPIYNCKFIFRGPVE